MPGRYAYDMSDDLKMLKSLYDRLMQGDSDAHKPCGLKIWRSIIEKDGRFKYHSAQALSTRMRRCVLPNLTKFCHRLSGEVEKKLIKTYKCYLDDNRKTQKPTVIEIAEESDTGESSKVVDEKPNEPYVINDPQRGKRRKLGRAIIAGIPKLKSSSGERLRRVICSEDEDTITSSKKQRKNKKNESLDSSGAVVDFLPDSCSPKKNKRTDDSREKKEERRKRKLFVECQNFLATPRSGTDDEDHDNNEHDHLRASVRLKSSLNLKNIEVRAEKSNVEKRPGNVAADDANGSFGTSGTQIHHDQNDMELHAPKESFSTNGSRGKTPTEIENQCTPQNGCRSPAKKGMTSPTKSPNHTCRTIAENLSVGKCGPDISQNASESSRSKETENTPITFANRSCQTSPEKLFVRKFCTGTQQNELAASPKNKRKQSESMDHSCQTSPEKSAIDERCTNSDNNAIEEKENGFSIYGLSAERIQQIFAENCPQNEISQEILIKMHLIDKICKKFRLDQSAVLKLFNLLDWELVAKRFNK